MNADGVQTPPQPDGKGTAATPQPEAQQPTQTTQAQQAPAQATTDDFSKWQRARDQERARLQAEAEQARHEAARAREDAARATRQAEEARLAGADPEEREKFYRTQFEQVERANQERTRQDDEQRRFTQRAVQALQKAGIDPNDARLTPYITGETWTDRLANLADGIAAIQSEEIEKIRAEVVKAEKRGAQQALVESGVTQVSGGANGTPPDAKEAKAAEYRKKLTGLKRTGKLESIVRLQTQAAKEGISL